VHRFATGDDETIVALVAWLKSGVSDIIGGVRDR
jgi:hypothetical protein